MRNLKNEKVPGPDEIINEQLKDSSEKVFLKLLEIGNKILRTREIPEEWKEADMILIHKKGDRHKIENYRPITLNSAIAKIFMQLIEMRIRNTIYYQQPREQAGLRRAFSTTDHLHTVNQIIQKTREYQIKVYFAFIDYTKAFDSLNHKYILKALSNQGISGNMVRIVE